MKLKKYLFSIFTLTLISLGIWLLIIFNQSSKEADLITYGAFFSSLLIFLSGFLSLVLFYVRYNFSNKELVLSLIPIAIRQSVLISLAIVSILLFQSLKVLTWWDTFLLIIVIILVELFFKTRKVVK